MNAPEIANKSAELVGGDRAEQHGDMKSKFDGQIIQYVPHGFVHVFEKLGWVVEPHILRGTHHGDYSDAMRWAGEGEPVFPTRETEAA